MKKIVSKQTKRKTIVIPSSQKKPIVDCVFRPITDQPTPVFEILFCLVGILTTMLWEKDPTRKEDARKKGISDTTAVILWLRGTENETTR